MTAKRAALGRIWDRPHTYRGRKTAVMRPSDYRAVGWLMANTGSHNIAACPAATTATPQKTSYIKCTEPLENLKTVPLHPVVYRGLLAGAIS